MPLHRVILHATVADKAAKLALQTLVDAKLGDAVVHSKLADWTETTIDGQIHTKLDVRFATQAEADKLWVALAPDIVTLKSGGVAELTRHVCPQDDPPEQQYNCRTDPKAQWEALVHGA